MAQRDAVFWSTVAQAAAAVVGVIVGIIAICISVSSMRATNRYAEAAMTPYLSISSNYDDGSVTLKNIGAGPAVIKRYLVKTASEVFDFSETNWRKDEALRLSNTVSTEASSFMSDYGEITKSVRDIRLPKEAESDLTVGFMPPVPGDFFAKDEEQNILTISGKHADGVGRLKSFVAQHYGKPYNGFDMEICYCSLNEASCYLRKYSEGQKKVGSCNSNFYFDILHRKTQ